MAIPESGILLTEEMLQTKLRSAFTAREHDAARAAMAQVEGSGPSRLRLQLAALRIADGSLARLLRAIEAIARDPRDVLAEAEYPRSSCTTNNHESHQLTREEMAARQQADQEEYLTWLTSLGNESS